ncbi:MAG: DapH/DapD/GlmU-related protein [Candidatus Nanoarchaeia archaeon]|jgi:acetyltransferase-like isoleucine patch superfamily enzyme
MTQLNFNIFLKILIGMGIGFIILMPAYPLIYAVFYLHEILPFGIFLLLSPILIILSYILFIVFFVIETKVILFFLKTKNVEGSFKTNALNRTLIYYSVSSAFTTMLSKLLNRLMINSSILDEILFKTYGNNVGKNCMIGTFILNPYLIDMGNNCVIGKNSILSAHYIVGNNIKIRKIKIGNNVTIGLNSIISPGVIIEDNVLVKINSFVKPNTVLKKNSVYAGNPAKFVKKINFSKIQ